MRTCGEEGCGEEVVARGMCSRHYQRVRRGSTRDKPGPAPVYTERFEMRLDPDLLSWVRTQGGASWVRHVLRQLRALSVEAGFARHWKRFQAPQKPEP